MNILPTFILSSYQNTETLYTGIDSPDRCLHKHHFKDYPYPISYKYNSRGFRDSEWPENLNECIWCIGDSFTSGVGQPYEHIWPQVLSNRLNVRTINVSMDGASNDWISRKLILVAETIKPKTIIVQWSYTNRREKPLNVGETLDDYDRRIHFLSDSQSLDDAMHTIECIKNSIYACDKSNTVLINSFIPDFVDPEFKKEFWNEFDKLNTPVIQYRPVDWARDRYHYDIKTSTIIVDKLIESKYIR